MMHHNGAQRTDAANSDLFALLAKKSLQTRICFPKGEGLQKTKD